MTNYDVVKKLIGEVRPKGHASIDNEILKNLEALCELHAEIHKAIDDIAYDFRNDKEASVKRCCDYANSYLDSLGIEK